VTIMSKACNPNWYAHYDDTFKKGKESPVGCTKRCGRCGAPVVLLDPNDTRPVRCERCAVIFALDEGYAALQRSEG
jgi:hypothetical protein